ncbi:MAG: response regulator [Deltaproteobacteria bacterium]|nr:response regulator [Deltaproteobacteria bacterium]
MNIENITVKTSICSFTGLTIIQHPKWIDIKISENYKISFLKIGNNIIYARPSGTMREFDADAYYSLREKFIEQLQIETPFIEIVDYENLSGRPRMSQARKRKEYLVRSAPVQLAYISCNIGFFVRQLLNTATIRYDHLMQVCIFQSFKDAVIFSVNLNKKENRTSSFPPEAPKLKMDISDLEFNKDFEYRSSDGKARYYYQVIPYKLVVFSLEGVLSKEYIDEALPIIEKIYTIANKWNTPIYRLGDFSKITSTSLVARQHIASILLKFDNMYHNFPIKRGIIASSNFERITLSFANRIFKDKLLIFSTLKEALFEMSNQIEFPDSDQNPDSEISYSISKNEIINVKELIGDFVWDENRPDIIEFDSSNPLYPIIETLNIMHHNIKEFRDDEILQKQKLAIAKETAEAANAAKTRFLANISHELRTPLNGILGMSTLLSNTELTEKQKLYSDTIIESGTYLLNVIDKLINISEIESNKITLKENPFNLKILLQKSIDIIKPVFESKNIKFNFDFDSSISSTIIGDDNCLKIIIDNLLDNAAKFTEHGNVTLKTELIETVKNRHNLIQFSVIDTGIGLPVEKINELYDKFNQADSSTTRKYGGTGLGLSIANEMINFMGGKLGVDSTIKMGSNFYFSLQFKVNDKSENINLQNSFSHSYFPARTEESQSTTFKVLLVEDNITNQIVFKEILSEFNLDVEVASNGLEAVQKIKTTSYNLVFMDIQMPVLDGIEATKQIRSLQNYSNSKLPIIAITAHVMEEDKQRCFEAGMNGYISKPIKLDKLTKALHTWLNI